MVAALLDTTVLVDILRSAVSHRLELPLYTCNLKHFAPLLGPLARKPY